MASRRQLCDNDVNESKLNRIMTLGMGSLHLCLFALFVSTFGSSEPNNDGLPSSNSAEGPEEEWLPGPNPWVFDSASNPILQPPDLLEWILGDPAVIQLGNQIHMFANEVPCMRKYLMNVAEGMLLQDLRICDKK